MNNPRCPYCGAGMKIMVHEFYDGAYCSGYAYCPKCGSYGPSLAGDISKEQAHDEIKEAALRRPLQKPLTLEEMRALIDTDDDVVTYCEGLDDPHTYATIWYLGSYVDRAGGPSNNRILAWDKYGKRWRAWAQRPTDEEREAAPWEEVG